MAAVPLYECFDVHSPNAGVRWGKYLERFINTYLVAHAITNGDRKKGLLLLSAGPDLEDIYDTLKAPEDSFDEMTEKLTGYFAPQTNTDFEIYKFRQIIQKPSETVDQWCTRLRQQAKLCNFTDQDKEIKAQIVQFCQLGNLCRRILRDNTLDLNKVLTLA